MGRPPANRAQGRPTRTPLGFRSKLSVPKGMIPDGMVGRWINDRDGRIQAAQEAGYTFITSDEKTGDPRVADPEQLGSVVSKSVGSGTKAFLMAIPKEFYDEDQAAKQARVNASEDAIRKPKKKLSADADGNAFGEGLTDT